MIDLKKTELKINMPIYYVDDCNKLHEEELAGFKYDKDSICIMIKQYGDTWKTYVKNWKISGSDFEVFASAEEAIDNVLNPLKDEYKFLTSEEYKDNIGTPDENKVLMLQKSIEFLKSQSPFNKICKEIKETSEYISNGLKALGYDLDQKKLEKPRKFILIIHHGESGKGFWAQPIDFNSDVDGDTLDEIAKSAQELIDVWIENNPDEVPKSIDELGIELYKRMTDTNEVVGYLTIIPSVDKEKLND